MEAVWSEYLKRLREAPDTALEWSRSGMAFVRSSIGSLPFLASTSVDAARENPDRDETHYFLVPDPRQVGGFMLAESRRLPDGVGAVNSLPKVRVFHVHDRAAVEVLEEQLAVRLSSSNRDLTPFEGDLAARLEAMGEEIDKQSNWVTGGLIVVGGVVAIANPLLGVGIAAKALLPEIGGKLAKLGFGAAAESMRRVGDSIRQNRARSKADSEVKRMKAELVIDPVLAFLDRTVARGGESDPVVDELSELPEWWRDRDQRLTMTVTAELWKDGRWADWAAGVSRRLEAWGS